MLETADLNDKICHVFVADTRFNCAEASAKAVLYNKIQCPIFEKQKTVDATCHSIKWNIEKR